MQAGVVGGVCLLAFLLSVGRTEELEGLKEVDVRKDIEGVNINEIGDTGVPDDLRSEVSLSVTERDNEERSGPIAQSSSYNFGGSPINIGGVNPYISGSPLASDGFGSYVQAKSTAIAGGGAPQIPLISPSNPEFNPYIPPGLSKGEAQAYSDSGGWYSQGPNSYPYSPSYPYNTAASFTQARAESDNDLSYAIPIMNPYDQGLNSAQLQSQVNDGVYQPLPKPVSAPILSYNNQGLSAAQAKAQSDIGFYQPGIIRSINSGPNNQGLNPAQTQADSESYQPIIKSSLSKSALSFQQAPDSRFGFPSYPYNERLNFVQDKQGDSVPYKYFSMPDTEISSYDSLIPYKNYKAPQIQVGRRNVYQPNPLINPQEKQIDFIPSSGFSSFKLQNEDEVYQPIPIPDPNPVPYGSVLVPYREPSSYITRGDYESYQSIQTQKPYPKQYDITSKSYNGGSLISDISLSYDNALTKSDKYQSISIPISRTLIGPSQGPNSNEENASLHIPYTYNLNSSYEENSYNILRSGYDNANLDIDINPNTSSSSWDLYGYKPYPPSDPNPKLYPSGAEAGQANPDSKTGFYGVPSPYSMGISSYAIDYPSESPLRSRAQDTPNQFAVGQTSPIAFEDAKSRLITPYEYVFPSKMPGGENVVECTKENEFHHFWSRGQDCLVCICLNEYGLIVPVCASCGGCDSPPPKFPEKVPPLPEPVPVSPEGPVTFEPPPLVSGQYPQPEPNPPGSIPPLYQSVASPEPYPLYPESIIPPLPVPVAGPQSVPTLPTPPAGAMCSPLPSGQPFTNPLHPCQICVCKELYVSGKIDAQIQCKENPQCIAPADVTTLPPLPDMPIPIPLPMCEKFPEHVLFPHPTDGCKLCKCSKNMSEAGVPEQQITCYPHPDCVPKVEPVTEPGHLLPPPLPIPIEPYKQKPYPESESFPPMPEIVTAEPLPWPPITTIGPLSSTEPIPVLIPRHGPLPGPSPHESCQPYPPNQTFQHPWDECQFCICSEAFATGMVTVEVNCYTKPSCCVELPEDVKQGYTNTFLMPNNVISGPDIQALPTGIQSNFMATSTFKPPSIYPSFIPRPVNSYSGGSQGASADTLAQPQTYSSSQYNRLPAEDAFAKQPGFLYQPNYQTGYVNQQYSDYSPRLPTSPTAIGTYKTNNYVYPGAYQFRQGDAAGNTYPGTQGRYQSYDTRYQGVAAPNPYPVVYQIPNYEVPIYPPGQMREGYVQPSTLTGSNAQNLIQAYTGEQTKSGNDVSEDSENSQ